MPVFYSPQADILLTAISVTLLITGVAALLVSHEPTTLRYSPIIRLFGLAAVIIAASQWVTVYGLAEEHDTLYKILSSLLTMAGCVPLLMAAAIEAGRNKQDVFRVLLPPIILLLAGAVIMLLTWFTQTDYRHLRQGELAVVIFNSIAEALLLVSVLVAIRFFSHVLETADANIHWLARFAVIACILLFLAPYPDVPERFGDGVFRFQWAFLILYLLAIASIFVIAILLWNVYARSVGVISQIRWWSPILVTILVATSFVLVTFGAANYRKLISQSLSNTAHNIAALVTSRISAAHARRFDPDALFEPLRPLRYAIGRTGVEAELGFLRLDAESGFPELAFDKTRRFKNIEIDGDPSLSNTSAFLWREMRFGKHMLIDGHGFLSGRVFALSPIWDETGAVVGGAVLGLPSANLARDLFMFKRLMVLTIPVVLFVMLWLLQGHQRAWLLSHSTNRSEALRAGIMANDFTGIVITRRDIIVDANRRLCDLIGRTAAELRGKNIHDVMTPNEEHENPTPETIHRALNWDGSFFFEGATKTAMGASFYAMVHVRRMADDPTCNEFIWEVFDISQHKAMEAEIRANRDFLQAVIDALPVPIFVKDADGRYQLVNSAFVKIMGFEKADDIIGKGVEEILPPRLAMEARTHNKACCEHPGLTMNYTQKILVDGDEHAYAITTMAKQIGSGSKRILIIGYAREIEESG